MSSPHFVPDVYVSRPSSTHPSSTSTLAGAMGDININPNSRGHRLPPSQANLPCHPSEWNISPSIPAQQLHMSSPHMPFSDTLGNISFQALPPPPSGDLLYHDFNPSNHRNASSDSLSSFTDPQYLGSQSSSTIHSLGRHRSSSSSSEDQLRAEIHHLRRKIRTLEAECSRARVSLDTASKAGPSHVPSQSPSFRASWKARTEVRKRIFCSFNRAGNALCAWHDSRRERRAYPPRNAPPGFLNCGCTHEEALFEESLARHGVGSYHPGESVRMDPALRNPLLKLLKQRYGYQDGDFERDPKTGEWIEGEGAGYWEQQANSGSSARRIRTDADRH